VLLPLHYENIHYPVEPRPPLGLSDSPSLALSLDHNYRSFQKVNFPPKKKKKKKKSVKNEAAGGG
jgi:hypothetical protein